MGGQLLGCGDHPAPTDVVPLEQGAASGGHHQLLTRLAG
jgi:hypothetical protein